MIVISLFVFSKSKKYTAYLKFLIQPIIIIILLLLKLLAYTEDFYLYCNSLFQLSEKDAWTGSRTQEFIFPEASTVME